MNRIKVADASSHVGKLVELAGWLYNLRGGKKICFPHLRDGSGIIQCVAVRAVLGDCFESLHGLTQESSLKVRGVIRAEQRASGGFEIDVEGFDIVQRVPEADPYPITPKEHGIDFLMDYRHLWLRSRRQAAVLRVRAAIVGYIAEFFKDEGFLSVQAPVLVPSAGEATMTSFPVQYFDDETVFLTQSAQFHNEAMAMALGNVYSFGPVFRGDKSKTRRHLTEFWMVEAEMPFGTLEQAQTVAEELISGIVTHVLDHCKEELRTLERDVDRLPHLMTEPFGQMTYDEAVGRLQAKGSDIEPGGSFGNTDETLLTEGQHTPLFVSFHPLGILPFHVQPTEADGELGRYFNMIAPEGHGEIITGAERIHDLDLLQLRMAECGLSDDAFQWYVDLRKYGSVPHAGFRMGLERVVGWMCGLEHVREATAFARMLYRTKP